MITIANWPKKGYETQHDWVQKVFHWELCKRLKFDSTDECYPHKPESFQENLTHKTFWDFELKRDNANPAKRPDNN